MSSPAPRKTYDVVIVGAGPVGLFLACELGLAGISTAVLERESEADLTSSVWKTFPLGMRGLHCPSVEALYRRGLLSALFARTKAVGPFHERPLDIDALRQEATPKYVGHWAGFMLDGRLLDRKQECWRYKLPGPSLMDVVTTIGAVQGVLLERLRALPTVDLFCRVDVTGVVQDDDDPADHAVVQTTTRTAKGEPQEQTFTGKWIVACDGGRSTLRQQAAFAFAGTPKEFTGYTVKGVFSDPYGRIRPGITRLPGGVYGRFSADHVMVAVMNDSDLAIPARPEDKPKGQLTAEHFTAVLRRVVGADDVSVTSIEAASVFSDRCLQADTYRRGRVLLAGDAAHVHSNFGGQGMNCGIGDAMNLGWKLAAVIRGKVPADAMLASYTRERHPVGAWVLDWSRSQVATIRADPTSQSLAKQLQALTQTADGCAYFVDKIWGLTTRYEMEGEGEGRHKLVGCSAPDFEFAGGMGRLGERLHAGRGALVEFRNDGDERKLEGLARRWAAAVDYVAGRATDELCLRALLVRPDGFVAWVAPSEGEPDLEAAEAALQRWFGLAANVGI